MLDKRASFLQSSADMNKSALPLKRSIICQYRSITLLLIPLTLVCFALSPQARAVCQEGCFAQDNTILGDNALLNVTAGDPFNVAIGSEALKNFTSGSVNVAVGDSALENSTSGSLNAAIGGGALFNFDTGNNNTAIGAEALWKLEAGGSNIAVGANAGTNLTHGDSNIYIGNSGTQGENKKIRIGTTGSQTAAYIAGISGATIPTGVPVIVDTTGHLGTTTSSARYKDAIKPMDNTSEALLALKPVTFRYKHEPDPDGIPQFGLVAEEVEKVNPDLVARDDEGKPYTVRYEAVNAMLLNEFLKEHRKVEQLKKDFDSKIAEQQKQIEALTAGLQKVGAQLEIMKPMPQTVQNRQ